MPDQENRQLVRSAELKRRAERLIPSCTHTFSKGPTQFVQGTAPVFLAGGEGSHVWDVDGNEYIDYPLALGPVILGYADPSVNEAVVRQLRNGTVFSLPHPLEVEAAELLVETIPWAEMVRFGKNGSDATSAAVRLARAYTGRDVVACSGYHGWHDWYIGTTSRSRGVPKAVQELTVPFRYNDLESLRRVFEEHRGGVAAVVMEPLGVEPPEAGFLEGVRGLTREEGALLVFDEIVSGFRVALGGAGEYLGVTPDLACFGKAMANGLPLSAVVGRSEVMELFDEVFYSLTFGGETLSLAAFIATLRKVRELDVIGHLWRQGEKLKQGYNALVMKLGIADHTGCKGFAPRTVLAFWDHNGEESLVLKSLFQQEAVKRGVLTAGYHNLCYAHSDEDIERTLEVYRAALERVGEALEAGDASTLLDGPPVQPVFRQV